MEIPFTVKPRPDTGLWNAKVGIWLFLASEVMLFGGLFSGYLFLRLGAGGEPDYFWPKGKNVKNFIFGLALARLWPSFGRSLKGKSITNLAFAF